MRIKGVLFIAIIVGITFALNLFFTNSWLKNKIEYNASVMNEAKVEFDGFDFSLFQLKMSWDRLQVANSTKHYNEHF